MAVLLMHSIQVTESDTAAGSATNTIKYYFLANPKTYEGIANDLGIDKANDDEKATKSQTSVAELLRAGSIVRANIYTKRANGKRLVNKILCPINRLMAFRKKMIGKTYNGGTVTAVQAPRRASFY